MSWLVRLMPFVLRAHNWPLTSVYLYCVPWRRRRTQIRTIHRIMMVFSSKIRKWLLLPPFTMKCDDFQMHEMHSITRPTNCKGTKLFPCFATHISSALKLLKVPEHYSHEREKKNTNLWIPIQIGRLWFYYWVIPIKGIGKLSTHLHDTRKRTTCRVRFFDSNHLKQIPSFIASILIAEGRTIRMSMVQATRERGEKRCAFHNPHSNLFGLYDLYATHFCLSELNLP